MAPATHLPALCKKARRKCCFCSGLFHLSPFSGRLSPDSLPHGTCSTPSHPSVPRENPAPPLATRIRGVSLLNLLEAPCTPSLEHLSLKLRFVASVVPLDSDLYGDRNHIHLIYC